MIEFKNINLSFDNKSILRNFSLYIRQGEKLLIKGKSGSGKTSLLKLLLGFTTPNSGEISFNKQQITQKNIWDIRKETAYIDQNVNSIGESVLDWFHFLKHLKANKKINFSNDDILKHFHFFHLDPSLLNASISSLSGGEKQRISIITALLLNRKIFLLDEITASLDTELKRKTAELFLSEPSFTVLAVSHDDVWTQHPNITAFNIEEKQTL